MHVKWTGRHVSLSPAQVEKLEADIGRVGKLLDSGKGEADIHVVLTHESHTNNVELKVNYHHHELVANAHGDDLIAAAHAAVGKLEQQALKLREKWRDSHRG